MRIKKELDLMDGIFNIYDLSENSLKPYMYESKDLNYLNLIIQAYGREKNVEFEKLIDRYLNSCIVINYEDYPLPGLSTKDGRPIVNLASLKATSVTDLQPADVYSVFAYSILFSNYVKNKLFRVDLVDQISLWIFNSFMGIYGKKSGLIGSYSDLTPKLRFIIILYTYDGMFGVRVDKNILSKASGFTRVNPENLKLSYDFSDPKQFLKCIKDNGIISISENKLATDIIRLGGIYSIPMFEDVSRLFSTILASTVKGNNIFSNYWAKKSKNIFEKMVFFGSRKLR